MNDLGATRDPAKKPEEFHISDEEWRDGLKRWQRDRDKYAKWKAIERQESALAQGRRKDWK